MENKEVKTKQVKLTKDERFADLCAMEMAGNVIGCIQMMEKSIWPGKKSMALSQTTIKNIIGEIDKFLDTVDGHFYKAMKEVFELNEKCPELPKDQKISKEEVTKEEVPEAKQTKKPAKTTRKPVEKTEKPKKETKTKNTKKTKKSKK